MFPDIQGVVLVWTIPLSLASSGRKVPIADLLKHPDCFLRIFQYRTPQTQPLPFLWIHSPVKPPDLLLHSSLFVNIHPVLDGKFNHAQNATGSSLNRPQRFAGFEIFSANLCFLPTDHKVLRYKGSYKWH
jgi:hypothetical protein